MINKRYLEEVINAGFEHKIKKVEKLTKSSVYVQSVIDGDELYVSIMFGDGTEDSKQVTDYFNYIGMEEIMVPLELNRTFVGKI